MIFIRQHILLSFFLLSHFALGQTNTAPYEPLPEEIQRAYFAGQNHLLKGDLAEAYSSFQVCAEAEPEVSGFHYELGKIELTLGNWESGLNHLDKAIKLAPNNDWYHYYRGLVNLNLENYDDAWTDLMVWVKERPGDLEALDLCAELFILSQEIWHAYQVYSFYEDEIVKNLEVRVNRLMLVINSQLNDRQIKEFINDAIKDFPKEPLFKFEKAGMMANDGEFEKAMQIYESLIKSNPDFLESYLSLAKCHLSINSSENIYPLLEKAFKSEDIDPAEKLNLMIALQNEDQIDNLLLISLDAHPEDPRLNHFVAMRHVRAGNIENGALAYEKTILYNPSSLDIREEYLYLLYVLKDWDRVINAGNDGLTYFPLEPVFNYYIGIAHVNLDDHHNALKAFKNGLDMVYDDPELGGSLSSQIAMSYREIGELEKSYEAFEESLDYYEDSFTMNNYAYFLATDKVNIQRALELSTIANETRPDEPNFLDTHALILFLLDRNEEALEYIQKAQTLLGPDATDAVFSEREGDILWELGQHESARLKWEEAIKAGGGKKRLNEKLSRITP